MKNTIQTTLTMEMPQKSKLKTYQTLTSWLEDFLAKLSAYVDTEKDSMIQEELSFLKSQGFYKTKDPNIFYSKMYETYYLTTMEKLSKQYLKFSPTWIIMLKQRCIIPKITMCHKGERECSLKDILLTEPVDEKYYLSEKTAKKLWGGANLNAPIQLNNDHKTYQDGRIYSDEGLSICINARGNNGWYQISDNEYCPVTKENDMFALTTRHRGMPFSKHQDNYIVNVENKRIRKPTPVECERLQGFPDNWTKYGKEGELISDTQRYKCCGNAVTTNVITAIVNEMFTGSDLQ